MISFGRELGSVDRSTITVDNRSLRSFGERSFRRMPEVTEPLPVAGPAGTRTDEACRVAGPAGIWLPFTEATTSVLSRLLLACCAPWPSRTLLGRDSRFHANAAPNFPQ